MSVVTKAKTLGNVGITVAAILALGVAALMFVPGVLGFDRYVITGGSMSGTFERGALVFERQVPVADLRVGDVITYLPPADSGVTELVTHRISSIEPSPDAAGALMFRQPASLSPPDRAPRGTGLRPPSREIRHDPPPRLPA